MLTAVLVTVWALGSFTLVGAGFFTLTGDEC
jgi:hypothetical protein